MKTKPKVEFAYYKPLQLFTTPDEAQAIVEWIQLHNADDQIHLYTVHGMTWNWIAKEINAFNTAYKLNAGTKINEVLQREGVEQAVIIELLEELDIVDNQPQGW